jgi:hypothetical protein
MFPIMDQSKKTNEDYIYVPANVSAIGQLMKVYEGYYTNLDLAKQHFCYYHWKETDFGYEAEDFPHEPKPVIFKLKKY